MLVLNNKHYKGRLDNFKRVMLKGSLEGSIEAKKLIIAEGACVEGTVVSEKMEIHGVLKGHVICRGQLSIGATARIDADIQYEKLEVESGALLTGRLIQRSKAATNNVLQLPSRERPEDTRSNKPKAIQTPTRLHWMPPAV